MVGYVYFYWETYDNFILYYYYYYYFVLLGADVHFIDLMRRFSGRGGASNLPWRGSWRGNVTIALSSCQIPLDKVR